MNNLNMGYENIVSAEGFTIAMMGILIVFVALAVIAFSIAIIPKLLPFLEKLLPEAHPHHEPSSSQAEDHEKVLAAIGYALFCKEAGSLPAK